MAPSSQSCRIARAFGASVCSTSLHPSRSARASTPCARDLAAAGLDPCFQHRRVDFRVELQREDARSERKRLFKVRRARREARCTVRELVRIAVPVQHVRRIDKRRKTRCAAGGSQRDRRKAELERIAAMHACTHRRRDQLRAEADAERRPIGRDARLEKIDLVSKEWVGCAVGYAHRAPEDDQQRGVSRAARRRVGRGPCVVVADVEPRVEQRLCEKAEAFVRYVPDRDRGFRRAFRSRGRICSRCGGGHCLFRLPGTCGMRSWFEAYRLMRPVRRQPWDKRRGKRARSNICGSACFACCRKRQR